ncbi:U3 small nucleolar ribonucleoprotein complex [Babesia duncani]|uniref:U3 small nucleolar ribonucleoprotein complex n=1 Tax=Babesia duncani TaxID=323732 RepID=A0AAD9PLP7_9APIC|nr:U3 small nucleolar ribonucleoprotein complex [Babesia duncani]
MSQNGDTPKSVANVSVESLLTQPWDIWRRNTNYQEFVRQKLLKYLNAALEIRFRRLNYNVELEKKRSRKGAAAKRALVAAKKESKRLTESMTSLDLQQLWTTLESKVSGGIGDLGKRLDRIIDDGLSNILKNQNVDMDEQSSDNEDIDEIEHELSESDSNDDSDDDSKKEQTHVPSKKADDLFFSMEEMEKFANADVESDDIDYFDSLGEESDGSVVAADMKFADFFKDPNTKPSRKNEDDADGALDDDASMQGLSGDELELERILRQVQDTGDYDEEEEDDDEEDIESERIREINRYKDSELIDDDAASDVEMHDSVAAIERELAADKHWSLMGEAMGSTRPRNSLLDVDLELPHLSQAVYENQIETDAIGAQEGNPDAGPVLEIEDIIRQRIKSRVFDNVERKMAPEDQLEAMERLKKSKQFEEVDVNKSNVGLGDLYAQRYMDHFMATDKLDDHKRKLTESFAKLMCKLDALSNYNMVPKLTSGAQQAASVPLLTVEAPINIITTQKEYVASESGAKVTREAKKRKFNNKLKALLKSGKIDQIQLDKIKASIKKKNQQRVASLKMAKESGNVKQKDTRRLNIGELMQSVT